MKWSSKGEDVFTLGVNFGIIRLGPAAGKLKYTLLDKQDIGLVREFHFEAFVDIDRDGEGACVFALAFDVAHGRGKFVQDLLWERHYGGIAPGFRVFHRNGITVDNRLENLFLGPLGAPSVCASGQDSLYWSAIVGMPHEVVPVHVKLFSVQEETFYAEGSDRFFECHHPPCTRMEPRPRDFSLCSVCHVARYCSHACQKADWPRHKSTCAPPHECLDL